MQAKVEALFCRAATSIEEHCGSLEPIHKDMPRPYVGDGYETPTLNGKVLPKILALAINQGRQRQEELDSPEKVRLSLYNNWYAPRWIVANFSRWIYALAADLAIDRIVESDVERLLAFDNCVKWAFQTPASKPAPRAWEVFRELNKDLIALLRPDIILAVGQDPYEELANYGQWKNDLLWRTGTLRFGNSRVAVGCFYHSSYGVRLKYRWRRFVSHRYPLPKTVITGINAYTDQAGTPEEIERTVEGCITGKPWWNGDSWAENYGEPAKFLAWHVCVKLVRNWRQATDVGSATEAL
jgi:hypothetical protein